ncbi:hypothetical protein [Curtobacterium sp. MCBA15_008]|uniref:hypothetical protein n=1 Tax=Curtobacterium sp. MCBA15_008 TaxID=1898736 RepID=UPI0008DCF200|nr:hypothetical protein [Curtobacterium sp. MCBA15_008]OII14581.1 hypothetical protein BIU96_10385 [Curtobacterium sp. MCBA15_008]
MGDGWQVDIAAAQAVIDGAANAGASMQTAAIDVDAALRDVVTALTDTDAVGAAQVFLDVRQGDATSAVRSVARAITAATGAMTAFAHADTDMASDTGAASARSAGTAPR